MNSFRLALLMSLLASSASAQTAGLGLNIGDWTPSSVTLTSAANGQTRLSFAPADWPSVALRFAAPQDWTGQSLELETFNPNSTPVEFHVRLDDKGSADGWNGSATATMIALPHQTQKWLIAPSQDPMAFGMRALPPVPTGDGAQLVTTRGAAPLNEKNVVACQLFLSHPKTNTLLDVGALKLVPTPHAALTHIVDEFGQFAKADWPRKIHSLDELRRARDAEERELKAQPQLSGRDRFGGDADGPPLRATGFFRTEKIGDRWWLVTPEGHRFWSSGIDCMIRWNNTITQGRETMFTSLPREGELLAGFAWDDPNVLMGPRKGQKSKTFNFYDANLARKYGLSADWGSAWLGSSLARLRSWGFNTVGNWSDDTLASPRAGEARVPYVATVHVNGSHVRVPSGDDYWGTMHDPFDPQFALDCQTSVAPAAGRIGSDPFCLGFFVDNELSWGSSDDNNWRIRYGLALGSLAQNADSPAKLAFLADLQAKYPTIEALNTAWTTKFASWNELSAPVHFQEAPNAACKADLSAFLSHFADQYFRTVRDAVKKAAPHHLYLGCRFAWRTPEAVRSAARFADLVSFNIYAPRLDENEWAWAKELNKPCLIGEFHMGALDRGMFHPGLVAAKDQNDRARMFADYLESVARNPVFVGAHWFQYVDEPLLGRSLDGENYNIGLVSVTDVPYPEMIAAARAANANLYRWHAGQ